MTLILHLKKILADDSGEDKKKDKKKKDVVDEAGHKGFVVVGFPMNIKQCYIYEKYFGKQIVPQLEDSNYIREYEQLQHTFDLSSLTFDSKYLEPKGFGVVINMQADHEVVYQRSVYKRKNPETQSEHNDRESAINPCFKKVEGYEEAEQKIIQHFHNYSANIEDLNT